MQVKLGKFQRDGTDERYLHQIVIDCIGQAASTQLFSLGAAVSGWILVVFDLCTEGEFVQHFPGLGLGLLVGDIDICRPEFLSVTLSVDCAGKLAVGNVGRVGGQHRVELIASRPVARGQAIAASAPRWICLPGVLVAKPGHRGIAALMLK